MLKKFYNLIKQSVAEWRKDNAAILAAAISFYAIFSIVPLIIIMIMISGYFFGDSFTQKKILGQVETMINPGAAEALRLLIKNAYSLLSGIIYPVVGFLIMLYGATRVFFNTQRALNIIWGVKGAKRSGVLDFIINNLISFLIVMGAGLLLILSLFATTALSELSPYLNKIIHIKINSLQMLHFLITFVLITFMFGIIYWVLPRAKIAFYDVWPGAVIASLLFSAGNYLIGIYLSHSTITSIFGTAASIIGIMIWVYYSAQIFLFGAEFTKVYSAGNIKTGT